MIQETTRFSRDTLTPSARAYLTGDTLLFDIETTGLSADRDVIYCIGCGWSDGDDLCVELLFAEDPSEEAAVLAAFGERLMAHPKWVTFNGTTFDLPFLQKRAARHDIALPPAAEHLDLYRVVRRMKGLLLLPSYKQKSVECFLGCAREDEKSGGELIDVYWEHVTHPDPALLRLLLLHNRDDVRGMFDLLSLLAYRQLPEGDFAVTDLAEETEGDRRVLEIRLCLPIPVPQSIHRVLPEGSFVLDGDGALVRLPIHHGTLRHFFPDVEHYYYLPDEDTAVHESVGAFVDRAHRVRATRQTCYVRQECDYITLPVAGDGDLKTAWNDPASYRALPVSPEDLEPLLAAWWERIAHS